MVEPQFTIEVTLGGEKPYQLLGWTKTSFYYNVAAGNLRPAEQHGLWIWGLKLLSTNP